MRTAMLLCALLASTDVLAQPTVFVVRHAERADAGMAAASMKGADPPLSDAGRQRAATLAKMLKDASLQAIFVTEYRRTQDTAAPTATAAGIAPRVIPSGSTAELIASIKRATGNVLVVGHSNTVPEIVKALGATVPPIADHEHDNLYLVVAGETPRLIRLRY